MLLVRAAAAGVDLSTAIADLAAPAPLYRFQILVQKAVELCQDVKALGSALLSALERRDAEELSRIQAVHEVALLKRVSAIKEDQIKEAKAQVTALQAARELAAERYRHYITLLGASPTVPAEGTAPPDAQAVAGAGEALRRGGARAGGDVGDAHRAGRRAVALPRLAAVVGRPGREGEDAVAHDEVVGHRGCQARRDILEQRGAGIGPVGHPELEPVLLVLGREDDPVAELLQLGGAGAGRLLQVLRLALAVAVDLRKLGGERLRDRGGEGCLLYTSPSPRDGLLSRMPSSA